MKRYLKSLLSIILLFSLILSNTLSVNAAEKVTNVYASSEKEFYQYINEFMKGEYKKLNIYLPENKFEIDKYLKKTSKGTDITHSISSIVSPFYCIIGLYNENENKYRLHYYYECKNYQSKVKKTEEKANKIIKKIIKNNMNSQQKVTAIAKYLKNNAIYATTEYKKVRDAADKNNNVIPNKIFVKYGYAYDAYGALCKGRCVCAGYSLAFNLLARKAGIPSIQVINGNHAWNVYKVGKKYYEIDTTAKETKGRLLKKPTFNEKKIYKDLLKYIVTGTKKIKMTPYTPPENNDEDYDDED